MTIQSNHWSQTVTLCIITYLSIVSLKQNVQADLLLTILPTGRISRHHCAQRCPEREESDAAVLPGWCVGIVKNKLVDLVTGMEEKVCQSLHSRDQGMCSWLKQRSHVCYSSCNWSHHLVNLTITPCHSPGSLCPVHRPVQMIGNVVGITKSAPFNPWWRH